jgi:hypothetical protein
VGAGAGLGAGGGLAIVVVVGAGRGAALVGVETARGVASNSWTAGDEGGVAAPAGTVM